jgi:hypothetical protein
VFKGKDPTTEVGSCSVSTTFLLVILPVISSSLLKDKQGVQSLVVVVVLPSL